MINLTPNQHYAMEAHLPEPHMATMRYTGKEAKFEAFNPDRDADQPNIYIQVCDNGCDMSYDHSHWVQVAGWSQPQPPRP